MTIKKFCSNTDGEIVLTQRPNIPILAWLTFSILSRFSHGQLQNISKYIAFGSIFTWSWLEIRYGDSPARRLLGAIVLIATIASIIKP